MSKKNKTTKLYADGGKTLPIPTFTWDYDTINEVADVDKLDTDLNAWLIMTDGMERHVIYKGNGEDANQRFQTAYLRDREALKIERMKEENKDVKPVTVYFGDKENGYYKVGKDGELSQEVYEKTPGGKYEEIKKN